MALKGCKECGKEISDKAKSCPNCGAKMRGFKAIPFLVVSLFIVVVLHYINKATVEKAAPRTAGAAAPKVERCGNPISAYTSSQDIVKKNIVSPSTAKFPYMGFDDDVRVTSVKECEYVVVSYLDAQNKFGALIRSKYSIVMRYDKEKDVWIGKDLNIQ